MKKNAHNSTGMKLYNRQLIINIIRNHPVSRAELARRTGLTRAAISIIVDELVNSKLICEVGTADTSYGRKPILLDINPDSYYAIGLNISRSSCFIGVVNINGELIIKKEVDLSGIKSAQQILKIVTQHIQNMIAHLEIESTKYLGLGISVPGPLDADAGVILNPPNFDIWHNTNIIKALQNDGLHYPIFVENNSAALALAEKNYGVGKALNSFMLLVVDTGIGSGIIIDHKLYRGWRGFGSEVGHTSINYNGKQCDCGNRGCLELYASIPAILKYARLNNANVVSWAQVVDGALQGDPFLLGIIQREAQYLSAGIVNAINILELEAVILTGYISYKSDILIDKIKQYVNTSHITRNFNHLQIYCSPIGESAELVAAATIVFEKLFSGSINIWE